MNFFLVVLVLTISFAAVIRIINFYFNIQQIKWFVIFKQVSFAAPTVPDVINNIFGIHDEVDDLIQYIDCTREAAKKVFRKSDLKKVYDEYSHFVDQKIKDVKNCYQAKGDDKTECITGAEFIVMEENSSVLQILMDNVSLVFISVLSW